MRGTTQKIINSKLWTLFIQTVNNVLFLLTKNKMMVELILERMKKDMFRFFDRLRYRFSQYMQGRYGFDALSKTMLIAALGCAVLSNIPYLRFFYFLFIILTVLTYIRCFSKNIGARQSELYKYFEIKNKLKSNCDLKKKMWSERKTHCYFKCSKCKALLRVPKGKGKIEVTCRVCGDKTVRKS